MLYDEWSEKMVKIISINNFKGGVGKTSTTVALSYLLAEKYDYKVLVIDLDPQADTTDLLFTTYKKKERTSLYNALKENKSANDCVVNLNRKIDIIPANFNLIGFPYLISEHLQRKDSVKVLYSFIKDIKNEYDFVLIDTPPTISDFSSNAIYACDYSLIVMQTHYRSYNAVSKFIAYLKDFKEYYNTNFDIIGILPVMMKKNGTVDEATLTKAREQYKEYIFKNIVQNRERIKRWDITGITDEDMHDKSTLDMYDSITKELLDKIK